MSRDDDVRWDDVHVAAHRLRDSPGTENAIACVAVELAAAGRFGRVLLSRVEGSTWTPRHWCAAEGSGHPPPLLTHVVRTRPLPLSPSMAETEAVRRRTCLRVAAAGDDPRTHRPFVDATATTSYIVAPIVVGEQVIALVHADHGMGGRLVSEEDHDVVRHFAVLAGLATDAVQLSAQVEIERSRISDVLAGAQFALAGTPPVVRLLDAPATEDDSARRSPEAAEPAATARAWDLSVREWAVLELMADGRTNREIADRLFVSESTVKTHIKHIFRKQGVTTRAESIARVWRRARWEGERAS